MKKPSSGSNFETIDVILGDVAHLRTFRESPPRTQIFGATRRDKEPPDLLIGNQIPTADPKKNRCFKSVPTKVLLLRRSTCPCLGSTIRLGPPQRGVPGDPFGLDPKNDEGLGGRAIETAEVAAEIRRHPLKILENRT